MKKYEVPAFLYDKIVKFVISVPNYMTARQVQILLMSKYYKNNCLISYDEITEIVELDLTKEEN